MRYAVLMVCSANMCRSPMAAALMRRSFSNSQLAAATAIRSCGLHPRGERMCDAIVPRGLHSSLATELRRSHRPTQLTADIVEEADLVLTADRALRSAVVRLSPGARAKVFTLREAAALAGHVVAGASRPGGGGMARTLAWFTAEMDASRGLIGVPEVETIAVTPLPRRNLRVHAYDIPDAHDSASVPHSLVRSLLVPATQQLATSLVQITG